MRWHHQLRLRLRAIFQRRRADEELDEELRYHLDRQFQINLERGMEREEAWRASIRETGRIQQAREECRDMRRINRIENLARDLRYALRMLGRSPGFTAVAVLTIALGIGANTAIFSTVNAVLLRPLPYAEPERLVQIWETHPVTPRFAIPYPDYMDWRAQTTAFSDVAAYTFQGLQQFNFTGRGEPTQIAVSMVSANLLQTLGIRPIVGRGFLPEEAVVGRDTVALISRALWQTRFSADPRVTSRHITINGLDFSIAGVLPARGAFPEWADVLLPISRIGAFDLTNRKHHPLEVIARLKPGVSIERAQSEVRAVSRRLEAAYPATNKTVGAQIVPLLDQVAGDVRRPLLTVLAAVGLVLLIACVNVANLLLARAAARRREVAVRIALGASRGRLISQFLLESLLLAFFGSALGLVFLTGAAPWLRRWAADFLPRASGIGVDTYVLLFAAGAAMITGILFGLAPALQTMRRDQEHTLRQAGRNSARAARTVAGRSLVAVEIAMAVVVLIGAGLLVRSFARITAVDPGFRAAHLLTFRLSLSPAVYRTYPQVQTFYRQLLPRLLRLPGVSAADTTNSLPLTASASAAKTRFAAEGAPPSEAGRFPVAEYRSVTPGFFGTMGIAIRRGRAFAESDAQLNSAPACIVNESLARGFFGDRDPVGRNLILGVVDPRQQKIPIVGVVADTRDDSLAGAADMQIYFPGIAVPGASVILRTSADPLSLAAAARREVHAIDPGMPVSEMRSMDDVVAASVARRRFSMTLMSAFSALALVLCAIGLYGIISWSTAQRTQELGVRQALGAGSAQLLWMVVTEGLRLAAIGVAAGTAVSLIATRALASLLYGTSSVDALTFAASAIMLLLIALVACLIPARRAARVDPMVALRWE